MHVGAGSRSTASEPNERLSQRPRMSAYREKSRWGTVNEPEHLPRGELPWFGHHNRPQREDDDEAGKGAKVAARKDQHAVPSTDCHTCRSASGSQRGFEQERPCPPQSAA